MSKSKKMGIAVGMAALALLGLTTGCQGDWRRGFGGFAPSGGGCEGTYSGCSLIAADSGGAPAYAELATVATGQIVRVWDESPFENVTLEALGGDFTEVAPGAYDAGPDGMIVAGDVTLDVLRCVGETEEEVVCAPIDAAAIEVDVLEDGARRVSYRGTSAEGAAIDGSFVMGR